MAHTDTSNSEQRELEDPRRELESSPSPTPPSGLISSVLSSTLIGEAVVEVIVGIVVVV